MALRLIRFQSDEIEALQLRLQNRDLDARREEALRRAQYKLDLPMKTFGKLKKKRVEDPEYRRWIMTQPCLICGSTRCVEAAHTGPHGIGIKSDDKTCLPLCRICHRTGPQSYHKLGPRAFERAHRVSLTIEMQKRNDAWEIENI